MPKRCAARPGAARTKTGSSRTRNSAKHLVLYRRPVRGLPRGAAAGGANRAEEKAKIWDAGLDAESDGGKFVWPLGEPVGK